VRYFPPKGLERGLALTKTGVYNRPGYTGEMQSFRIRAIEPKDQRWILNFLTQRWGSQIIVSRGHILDASQLPGFFAIFENEKTGLITYQIVENACEIVTLDSWQENRGIGTALIEAVKFEAQERGCHRLWLITTNDNLPAFSFYQKRGFHLAAVHPNAVAKSRELKPSIPQIGLNGIPIRDEIELEIRLHPIESVKA
jgi:ribosomal protein S18 acetylase RimI-like enzyme